MPILRAMASPAIKAIKCAAGKAEAVAAVGGGSGKVWRTPFCELHRPPQVPAKCSQGGKAQAASLHHRSPILQPC